MRSQPDVNYFSLYFLFYVVKFTFLNVFANNDLKSLTIENIETEKTIDQLLLLIQKRLVIMHEVARTKWNLHLPIEDLAREKQLLTGLVELAHANSLEKQWVSQFFQAQFDAAKQIQKADFALWQQQEI